MRLVKFSVSKKKDIFVNPDKVTKLVPYGEDKTLISFVSQSSTVFVLHDIDYVVSKLTFESE
jgi:hypothetical protein